MSTKVPPLDELKVAPLLKEKLPQHVAIIMDGNRRWALRQGLSPMVGHWRGAEVLTNIVDQAAALGIKVLTVYAFSTENWQRPSEEVAGLMQLFKLYLMGQKKQMIEKGVRLGTIGNLQGLPPDVRAVLEKTKEETASGERITLVLAINYGGRDDICRAVRLIAKECASGKYPPEEISEKMIAAHLDTAAWGDPDFLIRTSGEQRVSNFLLWQISYAEVYITEVLWPDFSDQAFLKALEEFQKRQRRSGG